MGLSATDRWAISCYNHQIMEIEMGVRERLGGQIMAALRADLRDLRRLLPPDIRAQAGACPGGLIMPEQPGKGTHVP